MGGTHITNDLAIGLKTDLDIAEEVKVKHAGLGSHKKNLRVAVNAGGQKHNFDGAEIHMIVEARVEEIMDYIDKELKKIQRSRKLPGGVVITGGTAKLPGIAEFAREKLELAARVGKLQPIGGLVDTVADPSYFTAVGLMTLDMLLMPISGANSGQPNSSVFGLVDGLIKRFKK
jgi:cell division protein FtsA